MQEPGSLETLTARLKAINKKIAFYRQHLVCPTSNTVGYLEPGSIVDPELIEALGVGTRLPLYIKPSDFIDEFGHQLVITATTTEVKKNDLATMEKLKNYMKRRFPERLAQCRALATQSRRLTEGWRARIRKREAEWGDPEDLGTLGIHSANPSSSHSHRNSSFNYYSNMEFGAGSIALGTKDWRKAHARWFPHQEALEPKNLLPAFFIPSYLVPRRLYHEQVTPISFDDLLKTVFPVGPFNANIAVWSPEEKKTFIELYLQHPKNFARIASQLPYKNCEQCVEFYYRHKREYRLKQMVVSYRRAMVAQRKLILNAATTTNTTVQVDDDGPKSNSTSGNGDNTVNISTDTLETSNSTESQQRKKSGRPVGRPRNKDRSI